MPTFLKYILVFCIISLLVVDVSFAQKKDKKKKKKSRVTYTKNTSHKSLSYEEKQEAKLLFIGGIKHYILKDYEEALKSFLVAEIINPSEAAIKFYIANSYMHSTKFDKAIQYAERAVALDNSNIHYKLLLAQLYGRKKYFTKAIQVYEDIVEDPQSSEEDFLYMVSICKNTNKYEQAIEVLNAAEDKFGVSEVSNIEKQKIYLTINKPAKALEEWKKFSKNHEINTEYALVLAKNLLAKDQLAYAVIVLNKLKSYASTALEALLLEAEILKKKGEKDAYLKAVEKILVNEDIAFNEKKKLLFDFLNQSLDTEKVTSLIRKMIDIHPESPRLNRVFADFLLGKIWLEEARTYYLKTVQLNRDDFSLWKQIIQIDWTLNNTDSIIVHAEAALEYFPNQAELYFYAGSAHYIDKSHKKAKVLLEQGKSLSGGSIMENDFNAQLGDVYHYLEEYSKSDDAFEAVLSADPNNVRVLNNYSYFLSLRKEKLEKAKKMSKKLISLAPKNATYLDTYGWVLYVNQEFETAKIPLEKAAKTAENGTITEHYGDVLFKLGQKEEAIRAWQKALEQGGSENPDLLKKKIQMEDLID